MSERLGGAEVEEGAAGGLPAATIIEKDRGGMAEVADRFDSFHIATLNGLEANGDSDKRRKLTGLPIAGKGRFRVPVASDPAEAARLAGGGGGAKKIAG